MAKHFLLYSVTLFSARAQADTEAAAGARTWLPDMASFVIPLETVGVGLILLEISLAGLRQEHMNHNRR